MTPPAPMPITPELDDAQVARLKERSLFVRLETLRLIERYGCSHTHMVPTQFIRMLQLPEETKKKYDVSAMKWAIHAAAPCPVDTKRKMLVVGPLVAADSESNDE